MSQKDLADWAFKERVFNRNRKRKSEGMHPEIEKALLILVNKYS